MSREIKYKAIESYGDCTTKFEIQGVEGMKVSEFISYIITNRPEDSGTFSIDGVKFPYDNKRRLLSISTNDAPCHLTIASVTAHGAYWQVDYEISTKNTTKPIMSRETTFKEGAAICGYEYKGKEYLESDISKCEAEVSSYKARIYGLILATPRDITPEKDDPIFYLGQEFEEIFDAMQEAMIRLANLYVIEINEEFVEMQNP